MQYELRPCPFCNNRHTEEPDENGRVWMDALVLRAEIVRGWFDALTMYAVHCGNCGARGGRATTEEAAVEYWNARGGATSWELDELERQEAEDKMIFGEDEEQA